MWESVILNRLSDLPLLIYLVIFLGMVVEGEVVLLAAVFAAYTGYLNFSYVLVVSFVGMMFGDILWYWIGPHFERLLIPQKIKQTILPLIDAQLKKRPMVIIFVAKYIYFFHRIALVRIKPSGIPFLKFFSIDLVAIVTWIVTSTILGVTFAASFDLLRHYVRFAEIALLVGLVVILTAEHYIGKYFRKKLSNW